MKRKKYVLLFTKGMMVFLEYLQASKDKLLELENNFNNYWIQYINSTIFLCTRNNQKRNLRNDVTKACIKNPQIPWNKCNER